MAHSDATRSQATPDGAEGDTVASVPTASDVAASGFGPEEEGGPLGAGEGLIAVDAPTDGKPYWRLTYYDHGRRRQLSGGKTHKSASIKAALILHRLKADLDDDLGLTRGNEVLDLWLDPNTLSKGQKKRQAGTLVGYGWYTDRYIRPVLGALRAEQWHRHHFRKIVQSPPTQGEGERCRRVLSSFLTWALVCGYITESQQLMLKAARWKAPPGHVAKPSRTAGANESGEDESYLPEEDAMDAIALGAVAKAMGTRYKLGELYVEFAAATGLRQGELFAVGADVVDLNNRRVRVVEQWNQKVRALTLPKGGKRRTTIWVAGPTITGYDLQSNLACRVADALAEREAGSNPLALLFPAPGGGHWNASNFDERVWVPAMAAAGKKVVPFVEYEDRVRSGKNTGQVVTRKLYRYTNHSTRDRFAISALNIWKFDLDELKVTGGWRNTKVIHDRYYGVAKGVLDRLQEKTRGPAVAKG